MSAAVGLAIAAIVFAAVVLALLVRPLQRIAAALESGALTGPQGPAGDGGPPGPAGRDGDPPREPAPPPSAHGLARVVRMVNGQWTPAEWVREHTPAWQTAFDSPGLALIPADGVMQLGNQDPI